MESWGEPGEEKERLLLLVVLLAHLLHLLKLVIVLLTPLFETFLCIRLLGRERRPVLILPHCRVRKRVLERLYTTSCQQHTHDLLAALRGPVRTSGSAASSGLMPWYGVFGSSIFIRGPSASRIAALCARFASSHLADFFALRTRSCVSQVPPAELVNTLIRTCCCYGSCLSTCRAAAHHRSCRTTSGTPPRVSDGEAVRSCACCGSGRTHNGPGPIRVLQLQLP